MRKWIAATTMLFGVAATSSAAELAVLQNGFTIRHERHEVVGETTRLYTSANAEDFIGSDLHHEIFGPSTIVVHHSSRDQILAIARGLEGQLTATIHGTEQDLKDFADLVSILETKVGRLVFNGFPTGVEVTHAMVHGGPYPSTSDGRSTSVGSQAIFRFTRLVCFQGFPDASLPHELKNQNPLAIWRLLNGEQTREKISAS